MRSAADIVVLVRAGLGDLAAYELGGGDMVGTDAYPTLRDAWPAFIEALASPAADTRMAAAYALGFLLEPAAQTQPALDAAVAAAQMPLERAAMILASGRLRTSIEQWRKGELEAGTDGLTAATSERTPVVRAALVIAELWRLPAWSREVTPEVAATLGAVDDVAVGPWGDGNLGRLGRAMRETVYVARTTHREVYSGTPDEDDALDDIDDDHRTRGDGPDIDDDVPPPSDADVPSSDLDAPPRDMDVPSDLPPPFDDAPIDPRDGHDDLATAREARDADADDDDDDVDDDDPIGDREVADPYMQDRPVRAAPPRVALPGLHDVDWSGLEHAYGKATGVPHMIDALSSPDAEDRRWAIDALFASINHQGSVYSASGPAAPFLATLVEDRDIAGRVDILRLLAGLAVHDPRWHLFDDLDAAKSPAFDDVVACGPTFVRLLADPASEIRTHAAYVLSFITPPDGAAVAVKRALAGETDRYTRSSLLLALGYVGRRTRSTVDRAAIERYLDDDCPLIAGSAAIALAQIDRDAASPRVRTILAKAITDTPPPSTGAWPWAERSVATFARTVRLAILSAGEILDEADAARARGDGESAREYGTRAFTMAFTDSVHTVARPWVPAELDDRQRRILRFLVSIAYPNEGGFVPPQLPVDSRTSDALGIPASVPAVRRLLGEDRGPLDREITIGERAVPAWFAITEVLYAAGPKDLAVDPARLDALRAALADVPPADRVAMIEDALSGPFGLHYGRAGNMFGDKDYYANQNDFTSRFLLVLATLLDDTALVGHAYARSVADEQLALPHPRSMRCLVAALVLARHAVANGEEPPASIDKLALTDQAPASTYRIAIRATLDLLAPERRARLLGDLSLYHYYAYRDPRGEVRRWHTDRGWDLLELLPPADRAAKILVAWREWQRHLTAGDDPHAEPVRGYSSSTQEQKPSPDQPFPRDRAIAILEACGDAGREALAALRAP